MANKILHLDISKDPKSTELSILPIIYGRVGDEDTQTVTIYTSKRDEEFNLSGWETTFEGTLADGKVKVFDTGGVAVKDATKGIFEYTFPNRAFSVAGKYERAYFSFVKGKQRATTEDFQIIVLENADITAEEAETIITEYNKLVKELQELQKKNIAELKQQQETYMKELDARVAEIKSKLASLETDIKKYEESVQKTATDAKNTISNALTEAVEIFANALEEFQNQNFYTKPESDTRFAKKTDLTKENVQLGNVDNYATANQTDAEQGLAGNKFITPMGVNQHVTSRMATQEEVNEGEATDKLVSPKTLDKKLDDLNVSGGFGAFNMSVFNGDQGQVTGDGIHGKEVLSGSQIIHMRPDAPVAIRATNGRIKVSEDGTYLFIIHTWYQLGTQTNGYLYFNLLKNGSRAGNQDRVTGQGVDGLKNRWDGTGQCVNTAKAGDEYSVGIETNITGSFTSVGTKTITVIKLA